jgi:hypothetical protein
VVEKITKIAHFILVKDYYKAHKIVHVFIKEIVRLDGFLKKIIYGRDFVFNERFWTGFQVFLKT